MKTEDKSTIQSSPSLWERGLGGEAIDSHQHFWHYHPVIHNWIDDEMAVIRKDCMPEDLFPVLQSNGINGCVAVQADQTEAETDFLIDLSLKHSFIKGVVGWVNLKSDDIRQRLAHYQSFPIVKGFRHILQGEKPEFMLEPAFRKGITQLKDFGFTYDLLLLPQHLKAALELVSENPNQAFVIDHISKPYIKDGVIGDWKNDIEAIAEHENVYCKVSGMVTEADYKNWKPEDFTPYLDIVTEAFGTNRLLFGSDWPVCLVAAEYRDMMNIVKNYYTKFSETEQTNIFGNNAIKFYNL